MKIIINTLGNGQGTGSSAAKSERRIQTEAVSPSQLTRGSISLPGGGHAVRCKVFQQLWRLAVQDASSIYPEELREIIQEVIIFSSHPGQGSQGSSVKGQGGGCSSQRNTNTTYRTAAPGPPGCCHHVRSKFRAARLAFSFHPREQNIDFRVNVLFLRA